MPFGSRYILPLSEFALTDISFARALVDSSLLLSTYSELESKQQSYFENSGFQALETELGNAQNLKILTLNNN